MAQFLVTSGVTYKLEELIKGTEDKLILISPYLQFSKKIKDNIENLNILKRDIRILYRENKLQVEENNWLVSQIGVRTSICSTLHAKCYLNEKEAIVTSMNLYSYSQNNNDEMGIYVTKKEDPELYEEILKETQRLLRISDEIRVSMTKVDKKVEDENTEQPSFKKDFSKSRLLTTKEISQKSGISSRKINSWFSDNKLMYKKEDDWFVTKRGKEFGGMEKEGQYGKFAIWPEEIVGNIK